MRKIIGLMITGCLMLSLCACGKTENMEGASTEIEPQVETEMDGESNNDSTEDSPKGNSVTNPYTGYLTSAVGLEYESNGDGTCAIVGIGTFEGDNMIIPQTNPDGETVVEVKKDAFYGLEVENLVFDNVSMTVGKSSFSSCDVKNIIINNSNLEIGENAFAYNDSLESFTLIGGECTVGEYVIYSSGKHMSISLSAAKLDLDDSAFSGAEEDSIVIDGCEISMGKNAFAYSDDIELVNVYNSTLTMDEYAFYSSGDDTEVLFDGCDITMEDSGLSGNGFKTVTISNGGIIEIGENGLAYSDDIESVTIQCEQLELGEYSFYSDDKIASVVIAVEGDIKLEKSAMSGIGKNLEALSITCNSIEIGDDAFAYNNNLISIAITGEITKKGEYAAYRTSDEVEIVVNGEKQTQDDFNE